MKRILVIVLLGLMQFGLRGQAPPLKTQFAALNKRVDDLNTQLKSLADSVNEMKKSTVAFIPGGSDKSRMIGPEGTVLWLTPIVLFFLFFFYLINKVNIKEALSDKDAVPTGIIQVPLKDSAGNSVTDPKGNTAAAPIYVYPRSSSRLALLFSSFVAIVIAISVFSTCIYTYLKTGVIPDFSKVVTLMLTLGIGVVPYIVNKVSSSSDSGSQTIPVTTVTSRPASNSSGFVSKGRSERGEDGVDGVPETVVETHVSMVKVPK